MTLAMKWISFRRKVLPPDAMDQQINFGQACFLGGAQASFQILANASGASQEDALKIWGSLQQEILGAVARLKEPPKEESRIVVI